MAHSQLVPKRPRDPNRLAKLILDIATRDAEDTVSESKARARMGMSGSASFQRKEILKATFALTVPARA